MKKIIINEFEWHARIAILRNNKLQNIYFAIPGQKQLERVFLKGIVTKILPGIQTAFVDIGQEKAGFLHISEIDRELAYEHLLKNTHFDDEQVEASDSKIIKRSQSDVDISNILKEGEPILVQVSKEPVYQKGAKLTTCFTLPGRFIVLMPNIARIGVSKKIEDWEERKLLKEIVFDNLPKGMGAIIRTTSEGRHEREIVKDIHFLLAQWTEIQKRFQNAKATERIHEDLNIDLQVVRDHLDEDVESIIVDHKKSEQKIYNFVKQIAPEYTHKVKLYNGQTPIFEYFNIEKQIAASLEKKVVLKSGGSLVIESTEAMTVIDVNTGKFTGKKRLEDTILKTNLEAAEETVRQLRLRNIGGLIVIDFIDMSSSANRNKLFTFFEKTLREHDKFQSVVLKVSEFGLVQMTRKRSGKTLVQQLTDECQKCHGYGFVKSAQTQTYDLLPQIAQELKQKPHLKEACLMLHPDIFEYLTMVAYDAILSLEKQYNCKLTVQRDAKLQIDQYSLWKK